MRAAPGARLMEKHFCTTEYLPGPVLSAGRPPALDTAASRRSQREHNTEGRLNSPEARNRKPGPRPSPWRSGKASWERGHGADITGVT